MGRMGKLLHQITKGVAGAPPITLTFVPSIPAPGIDGIGEVIEPDSCYIELYLESLRLERGRRFATRFHGVAYSFLALPREGEEAAQFAVLSKPEKLAELDDNSLDRVIAVSKQMIGPTPYRGGPVSLEFGLFSVRSGDLLTPLLDYMTRLSSTAGSSFVGALRPFVPLISDGMDLLAGQAQDTALEVGLDTDMHLDTGRVSAIIARPKGSIDRSKLSLDEDRTLLLDGVPLECGYAVFSVRRTLEKADYGEIPQLRDRYAAFQAAIRGDRAKDAQDALTAFRLEALASPDLISTDARRLYEKAQKKFKAAFPPGGIAAIGGVPREEKLSEIGLYD